jgi:DNA-binding CsgD family transcriptional regulator
MHERLIGFDGPLGHVPGHGYSVTRDFEPENDALCMATMLVDRTDGDNFIVDRGGRIIATNTRAGDETTAAPLAKVGPDQSLQFRNAAETSLFVAAFAKAVKHARLQYFSIDAVQHEASSATKSLVVIQPLGKNGPARAMSAEWTLVSIRSVNYGLTVEPQILRVLFGVTRAESEVLALVAAGRSIEAIAQLRRRKPVTVKNQRQSGLHKMGIPGDAELVAIVSSLRPQIRLD